MEVFIGTVCRKWQNVYVFRKRIKVDFYHVLKFEHRSMFRKVGTMDSNRRNVLKCGEKVDISNLF